MTTALDHDDTPSPTELQQFVYLANNLFELLQTAKRELERDREAAKASLVTASSILQSEIARARFHRRESAPHHPRQGPQRRSTAKHSIFLAVLQTSPRRTTARLRGE